MSTSLILATILAGLFLALAIVATVQEIDGVRDYLWSLCGAFLMLCMCLCYYDSIPSAIDVYQGKTELEYTVRGNEVVDSVVVYKAMED